MSEIFSVSTTVMFYFIKVYKKLIYKERCDDKHKRMKKIALTVINLILVALGIIFLWFLH